MMRHDATQYSNGVIWYLSKFSYTENLLIALCVRFFSPSFNNRQFASYNQIWIHVILLKLEEISNNQHSG